MIKKILTVALLIISIVLFITCCTFGSNKVYNPNVVVTVNEVYDGDTVTINWPNIHPVFGERISVRIRGIDAPEMKSKNKLEKLSALKSKEFASNTLLGNKVELRNIGRDKYFRLLADIFVDGRDFGKMMLDKGLAKPYDGGTKERF